MNVRIPRFTNTLPYLFSLLPAPVCAYVIHTQICPFLNHVNVIYRSHDSSLVNSSACISEEQGDSLM